MCASSLLTVPSPNNLMAADVSTFRSQIERLLAKGSAPTSIVKAIDQWLGADPHVANLNAVLSVLSSRAVLHALLRLITTNDAWCESMAAKSQLHDNGFYKLTLGAIWLLSRLRELLAGP